MNSVTAVELFSGMGSFAEACRDQQIHIVSAYDQSQLANSVYQQNFGHIPNNSTLDSISSNRLPDVDIWWMSPPCTPYSVRGKRSDIDDPRAKSLLNLIDLIPKKMPRYIFLENVNGFIDSQARKKFLNVLQDLNYSVQEIPLCATDFGVPMRRPRHYIVAALRVELPVFNICHQMPERQTIKAYLEDDFGEDLLLSAEYFEKYEECLNVVDPDDPSAICICFTKGYYQCRLAGGSLIKLHGRWSGRVRRFSSNEILKLFGFSADYNFPENISEEAATRLLGNAVDVRAVQALLKYTELLPSSKAEMHFDRIKEIALAETKAPT